MITNRYSETTPEAYLELRRDVSPAKCVFILFALSSVFGKETRISDLAKVDLDFEWINSASFYFSVRHWATPDKRELYFVDCANEDHRIEVIS
jgi:hypothetical protein